MNSSAGPFSGGWHEHTFSAVSGGTGTLMVDLVEFGSGFAPLGGIADRLVLNRYMCHLLRRRNAWLKGALEAAD
jgi:hypothetical protein